eukprot:TRINITY_DN8636_c0_g3_i1.p1 TRINITY_DN8636_c0_g3~~TRINITY_DN8636_c0_g3_i1.p1  ORF type:complete len:335 (-),score=64.99 TRINITY_DN8636_c0_g3_i1:12-1016(-)
MKKSLVALAALAVVGAASAQSSVTVYGRVEMGVQKLPGAPAKMNTSNGTSRLGFTGVEDLGGGLKATFKLEHRFNTESGTADGSTSGRPFWQGESTVGLAGSFGSVRLGRAMTAYHVFVDAYADPWGTERVSSLAPSAVRADTSGVSGVAFSDNAGLARTDAIHWQSADYSGFKGGISLGLKNQDASITALKTGGNTSSTKNFVSLAGVYAQGPVYVGLGYEQNRQNDTGWALAGSYDFGVAKVLASYNVQDTIAVAGSDYKATSIAVVAPVGAFTIKGGYLYAKAEGTGVTNGNSKLGLGVDYSLSKRTTIYTAYGKPKAVSASYEIGLNHTF